MSYPSFTVTIDGDGSGGCSKADVQLTLQAYGWSSDLAFELVGDRGQGSHGITEDDAFRPVSEHPPFAEGVSFCGFDFPG